MKHTQYFLRHLLFLQLHPLKCAGDGATAGRWCDPIPFARRSWNDRDLVALFSMTSNVRLNIEPDEFKNDRKLSLTVPSKGGQKRKLTVINKLVKIRRPHESRTEDSGEDHRTYKAARDMCKATFSLVLPLGNGDT